MGGELESKVATILELKQISKISRYLFEIHYPDIGFGWQLIISSSFEIYIAY